ncbi:transcriptional regulator, ArsR family [Magnetococcus marinus MC-1]|uniref:Transcriptional regulator, ArsR family n=1 Tax=Magnetococcus marinus (strain ATCC BAA-1437 / JCM 17883 / MC-1) TaxID=156889 RepID=A0L7R8_MAGMM|nr:helix-turn-helix domain-containing protein [Magnetococcus marinus]ABK44011.1 transcriptional regulator, ArsR family [Magnetococcus marinus MC-1]
MPHPLTNLAESFKALSEPLRVRLLLLMLHAGEMCVHECMLVTKHPQSTVSRHLGALYKSGWLERRRQGVWIYYSLSGSLADWKQQCIQGLFSTHCEDEWLAQDTKKLRKIRHQLATVPYATDTVPDVG